MPASFEARGSTIPDLFQDAAKQLLSLLIDAADLSPAIREKVVLEAPQASELLRNWIESLLRLASQQRILFLNVDFKEFKVQKGGGIQLTADVSGELIDPVRHVFRNNPFLLRPSQVSMTQEADGITAHVVFE